MNLSSSMHQGAAHLPRPAVMTIEAGLNDLINHWQQLSQSAPECGKPHPMGGAPTLGKDTYSHWAFLVKEILELIGPSSYQLRITSKVVDYVRGRN